jgi:hypothetical protein
MYSTLDASTRRIIARSGTVLTGSFPNCTAYEFTGTLVQRLACFEHLNELQQSPLASLGFFSVVQSLAVARAAGETAPLIFTILGGTSVANTNVFKGANTALPLQIFSNATQPYTGAQARAWGAALALIAIAFILMIASRLVTARFTRYSR